MGENNLEMIAYEIDPDEAVGCYFCINEGVHRNYKAGEAFLCEAGCPPFDGNANYVCKAHLDPDIVIYSNHFRNTSHG